MAANIVTFIDTNKQTNKTVTQNRWTRDVPGAAVSLSGSDVATGANGARPERWWHVWQTFQKHLRSSSQQQREGQEDIDRSITEKPVNFKIKEPIQSQCFTMRLVWFEALCRCDIIWHPDQSSKFERVHVQTNFQNHFVLDLYLHDCQKAVKTFNRSFGFNKFAWADPKVAQPGAVCIYFNIYSFVSHKQDQTIRPRSAVTSWDALKAFCPTQWRFLYRCSEQDFQERSN